MVRQGFDPGPEQRDGARVVDHLHVNDDGVGGLHDLIVVVVDRVEHSRSAGAGEADQAALGQGQGFRAREEDLLALCAGGRDQLPTGVGQRHLAAGGLNDPGGSELASYARQAFARIDPEGVVAAVAVLVLQQVVVEVGRAFLGFGQFLKGAVLGELGGFVLSDH